MENEFVLTKEELETVCDVLNWRAQEIGKDLELVNLEESEEGNTRNGAGLIASLTRQVATLNTIASKILVSNDIKCEIDAEKFYKLGIKDCFEVLKGLATPASKGGFTIDDQLEVFGKPVYINDVFIDRPDPVPMVEAAKALVLNKIKPGDEIIANYDEEDLKFIVIHTQENFVWAINESGCQMFTTDQCKKTGKKYPEIVNALGSLNIDADCEEN